MRYLFIYPYIAFCALFFYPITIFVWLSDTPDGRKAGYLNIFDFIKSLHNQLK